MDEHKHEWYFLAGSVVFCKCFEELPVSEAEILLNSVPQLEAKLRESEKERNKWRNYMPDDEDLAELKKQACYKGEYKDSLAANHVYIVALETRFRESEAEVTRMRKALKDEHYCMRQERGKECDVCVMLEALDG